MTHPLQKVVPFKAMLLLSICSLLTIAACSPPKHPLIGYWVPADPENNKLSQIKFSEDSNYEVMFKDSSFSPIKGQFSIKGEQVVLENYRVLMDNSFNGSKGTYVYQINGDTARFTAINEEIEMRQIDMEKIWLHRQKSIYAQ